MEHFEEIEFDTTEQNTTKWLRYIDDISVVLSHGQATHQEFLSHVKNLTSTLKFAMELDANNSLHSWVL
jgi:hypothetical protein